VCVPRSPKRRPAPERDWLLSPRWFASFSMVRNVLHLVGTRQDTPASLPADLWQRPAQDLGRGRFHDKVLHNKEFQDSDRFGEVDSRDLGGRRPLGPARASFAGRPARRCHPGAMDSLDGAPVLWVLLLFAAAGLSILRSLRRCLGRELPNQILEVARASEARAATAVASSRPVQPLCPLHRVPRRRLPNERPNGCVAAEMRLQLVDLWSRTPAKSCTKTVFQPKRVAADAHRLAELCADRFATGFFVSTIMSRPIVLGHLLFDNVL
jgi:hypothetical protein